MGVNESKRKPGAAFLPTYVKEGMRSSLVGPLKARVRCVSLPAFYEDSGLDPWVLSNISSNPARTRLTEALWSDGSGKN